MSRIVGTIDGSALAEGRMCQIELPPYHVMVARVAGRLHAMEDACPHSGWSLSGGAIEGEKVICPGHGWEIALASGQVLTEAGRGLACPLYDAREEDGVIVVRART